MVVSINLLPEEFRRRERTPLRIFAASVAAAVVVAAAGATLAYLHWGKLSSLEDTIARLEDDRVALEPLIKHHDALNGEISEHEKWRQTIREVRTSRVPWSAKLDQFMDLLTQAGDQGRYLIWFNDLAITQAESRGSGGSFIAKGVSGSDDVAKVASFLSDLRRSEFISDFSAISPPEGKVTESGGDLVPKAVWEFPLTLTLAQRDPKKAAGATAAPAAPSAPASAQPAKGGQ